jgi:integrase
MATIKIIVRAEKIRKNGEVPLYIRMTVGRKSKYISLGHTIPAKTWDADRERVRKSHPNSARLNAFLADKKSEVAALALDVDQGKKKVGRNGMRDALSDGSGESFIDFAGEFLAKLEQNMRLGTLNNYRNTLNCFRTFLSEVKGFEDLTFSRFTLELASEFKTYIEMDLGNSPNTIVNKFAGLKSIMSAAREAGIVEHGFRPLAGLKTKGKKNKKMIPSREEFAALEMVDLKPESNAFHIRNMYLFCANMAGLRFGDAVSLRWANITGDRLQWQTRKTNKQRLVYIPQAARDILDQYRQTDDTAIGFVFPFLRGQEFQEEAVIYHRIRQIGPNCNASLKTAWRYAGVGHEFSFHTSRHYFATDSLRRGMRVEVLQHLLTHSSLNQTMEYAQIANEDMDAAMRAYEAAKLG